MSVNDEQMEAALDAPEQDLPLEWIMASIAAWLLAFAIRNLLGAFLETPQGSSQIVQILYNTPAPLLVGLALGALQFYVLRSMLIGAWRWIVFSGLGYAIGAVATGVAAQALLLGLIQNGTITSQQQVDTLQIILQIVVALLLGVILGLLQWLVFRSSHPRSALWILAVGVGFTLATVTLMVLGTYVARPIASTGGFFSTGQGGLILEVILRLLSGAVFGGATLFGLQRILRSEPAMMEYDE